MQRETHVQSAIINWVGRKHASYWSIFLDSIDKLHWCSFNCRYLPCICSVDILDDSFVLCLCSFVCSPHYMLSNHFLHINQGTALDILPLFYHESYQYPKKLINLFFLFKSSIAHTWRKKLVVFFWSHADLHFFLLAYITSEQFFPSTLQILLTDYRWVY